MSDQLKQVNNLKGTNFFRVSSNTSHNGTKVTHIPAPIDFNANGEDCCPQYGSYQKQTCNTGNCLAGKCSTNNCSNCSNTNSNQPVYYNMQYTPESECLPEMLDICPKPSYKTPAFEIKEGVVVQSGLGINFKQIECSKDMPLGGILIENAGVRKIGITGQQGTGITVSNKGTLSSPNFVFNLNKNDLRDYTGYVTEILVNGKSYKPQQGILTIGGAGFGSPVSLIKSPNDTVSVSSIAPGTAGLDVKPIKINGETLQPDNDGHPINITDGNSTTVSINADNSVSINVDGAVTSVNGQTGAVSIPTLSPTTIYQGYKSLTAGEVTALTGSGLDISSLTPTDGDKPASFSSTKVVLYKNNTYMTLADYSMTGNLITSTLSFSASDKLSWVIFKN